jgi:DNA-binding NarL/FixJ family response regulator
VEVFVLDANNIYRRGLVATLELLDDVEAVAQAGSVGDAWSHPRLLLTDVVVLDPSLEGGSEFIGAVCEATAARVIVNGEHCDEEHAVVAIDAGAVGYLNRTTLTTDGLAAAIRAAASGAGVLAPELLGAALRGVATEMPAASAQLTNRELQVLALFADGHATRDVARELSYSERTVKNVLHDAVTKLHARSRSQAVACAVRAGLI